MLILRGGTFCHGATVSTEPKSDRHLRGQDGLNAETLSARRRVAIVDPPPIFENLWQGKEFRAGFLELWQGKELRSEDFG